MRQGTFTGADAARARLATKKPIFPLWRHRRRHDSQESASSGRSSTRSSIAEHAQPSSVERLEAPTGGDQLVRLSSSLTSEDEDDDKDVYRWAILYENQRGITIFSIPRYSRLGLLPNDPPAFTVPEARGDKDKQPQVSLDNYPLPDGNWRWVSKSWMIDMRGDGEVQYDGFEYNWWFRSHGWRAEVGKLSAGGWVRRRRWVRLMVKPAMMHREKKERAMSQPEDGVRDTTSISLGGSHPPSVLDVLPSEMEGEKWKHIWHDADAEGDWRRCHAALRELNNDGRKLEMWKAWLVGHGDRPPDVALRPVRGKQWTEDDGPMPSEVDYANAPQWKRGIIADRERISAVLCEHGGEILRSFIYPESRVQFIRLLGDAGLLEELRSGGGLSDSRDMVEFWSYTTEVERRKTGDEDRTDSE
ncbi:hypothetical protein PUNSTDRAFT_58480 [Punctularia strigosozonata HHB-11173 SS5]|uniref:uncharacterized protein n=1 Tax=Punctularia strigosozonata (strain HHB-11173) TaxID=741275 RepID=UPI00044173D4|nr:uncharacterized protein PUNSTDRAFT_58480 [Punctularia strigosozonata HHB-11173 SS5]EIN13743.1 hypothetical protein PUNSTDRAFT_58480 [Punctularia strigosozonata HHB-11173 SS5]